MLGNVNLPSLLKRSSNRDQGDSDLRRVMWFLGVASGIGAVAVCWHTGRNAWTTPLLWAAACFACGVVLGFLFGIPKTLQDDHPTPAPGTECEQRVNTNLEQISDWLTKILVGLGLTQIGQVWGYVKNAAAYIGPAMGPGQDQQIFVAAMLLYFSIVGFFGGYLLTRLFLAGAFRRAEGLEVRRKLDRTSADSDKLLAVTFMEVFCKDEETRKQNLYYIEILPPRLEATGRSRPLYFDPAAVCSEQNRQQRGDR